jgi:thymidine kinase
MNSYLEIIIGPMFSGKTKYLTQIYDKYNFIGKKIIVINHIDDTRYSSTHLCTHDKIEIPCIFIKNLNELIDDTLIHYDVFLIDEAQFFSDLQDIIIKLVEKYNKMVFIAGLDGDYKRQKFGKIFDLIPYCDNVIKLNSLCSLCKNGNIGLFSHLKIKNKDTNIIIGNNDIYETLCRKCYINVNYITPLTI